MELFSVIWAIRSAIVASLERVIVDAPPGARSRMRMLKGMLMMGAGWWDCVNGG